MNKLIYLITGHFLLMIQKISSDAGNNLIDLKSIVSIGKLLGMQKKMC
tara:strand:+ start:372 stop:515 length:144 start_codon:yes stop_codon:yes gene_type:complete